MSVTWLVIVQWLHVLAGIIWLGGHIVMTFAVWPVLRRRSAREAREIMEALGEPLGRLMGPSGLIVLLLGIVRGTLLGPVRSFSMVVTTPYGLTFLTALVVTLAIMIHGGSMRKRLPERLWQGDDFHPDAARFLKRENGISLIGFGIVLLCMVLMRFGL